VNPWSCVNRPGCTRTYAASSSNDRGGGRRARRVEDQRELHPPPRRLEPLRVLLEVAGDDRRRAVHVHPVGQPPRPRPREQPLGAQVGVRLAVDPHQARRPARAPRLALDHELVDDLGALPLHRPERDPVALAQPRRHPAVHVRVDRRVAAPHPPHHRRAARPREDAVPRQPHERVDRRLPGALPRRAPEQAPRIAAGRARRRAFRFAPGLAPAARRRGGEEQREERATRDSRLATRRGVGRA
jgi:hypothetical protein